MPSRVPADSAAASLCAGSRIGHYDEELSYATIGSEWVLISWRRFSDASWFDIPEDRPVISDRIRYNTKVLSIDSSVKGRGDRC